MDNCLVQMVMDGKIKPDTAVNAAADRDYVRKKVGFSV